MKERKIRLILLINGREVYYSGILQKEDDLFYYILDKYNKPITIGKSYIVSMEELKE